MDTNPPDSEPEHRSQFPSAPPEARNSKWFEPDLTPGIERPEVYAADRSINLEYRGLTPHFAGDVTPQNPAKFAGLNKVRLKDQQQKLLLDRLALKETIVCKLGEAGFRDEAVKLDACHTKLSYAVCVGCRAASAFYNRCEQRHCPCCQHRLARERRESVEFWAKSISQPKHVVLTARNTDILTREKIRWFKAQFTKLRRSKCAANWRGGMWSLEVTNEGRGWHVHLHALIDADFIVKAEMDRTWAKLVGQDMVVTCVKDVREDSYLREVAKYAVKPTQLAKWTGEQIGAFVTALDSERTFGVFGSLFKRRSEWKAFKEALTEQAPACECGCSHFKVYTDKEWQWELEIHGGLPPPKSHTPATRLEPQLALL